MSVNLGVRKADLHRIQVDDPNELSRLEEMISQ